MKMFHHRSLLSALCFRRREVPSEHFCQAPSSIETPLSPIFLKVLTVSTVVSQVTAEESSGASTRQLASSTWESGHIGWHADRSRVAVTPCLLTYTITLRYR
jgi:hypothetical protein